MVLFIQRDVSVIYPTLIDINEEVKVSKTPFSITRPETTALKMTSLIQFKLKLNTITFWKVEFIAGVLH